LVTLVEVVEVQESSLLVSGSAAGLSVGWAYMKIIHAISMD
jgi:hypothetical protein